MGIEGIAAVVGASVIPPIIYLIWVRQSEVRRREPAADLLRAFLFGATVSIGAAFLIESGIALLLFSGNPFSRVMWGLDSISAELQLFLLAVIIAPVVEELVKAAGLGTVFRNLTEIENGIIYGAAVGLGFAAIENILYLGDALVTGLEIFIVTAVTRAISSTLLHASATGVAGYGVARYKLAGEEGVATHYIQFLIIAILMHAVFNFFAILGVIYSDGGENAFFVGLIVSIMLAVLSFTFIRRKIRELDLESDLAFGRM